MFFVIKKFLRKCKKLTSLEFVKEIIFFERHLQKKKNFFLIRKNLSLIEGTEILKTMNEIASGCVKTITH